MDEDFANFAIDYATKIGAQYAEARLERGTVDNILLKNGNVEVSALKRFYGISVRVLADGALGFGTITKVGDFEKLKTIVEDCVKSAKAAAKSMKRKIVFADEKAHTAKYDVKGKRNVEDIGIETKLEALMEVEKNLPKNVMIPGRIFQLFSETREKYYTNTDGSAIYSKIPRIGVSCMLTVFEGGAVEQAYLSYGRSTGWEFIEELGLSDKVNKEALMLQKVIKEGVKPPTGEVDVVCGPEVVGIAVHESCGHPYEADRMLGREAAQAGESFVTPDMIGKKIGSEIVTVIDDPTVPTGYGYYKYDDEGVAARARYLILNGKINEFLHNRETAAQLNVKSNGSARANNYDVEPIVRMAHTYMKPGDHKFDELIEGIKTGVFINTFTEWNIDDKRYNQKYVGREAYLIENGELKNCVRRPVLELTTPTFYSAIDAISKDLEYNSAICGKGEPAQGIPVDHGGPSVRLRNIRLGKMVV